MSKACWCAVAEARAAARLAWLQDVLGHSAIHDVVIEALAGDASFRRYFRVQYHAQSFVLMDAPPPHEDVRPFLAVRTWLEQEGLRVSHLQAENPALGFLLLEDFGDVSWSSFQASGGDLQPLFEDALRQLHLLQQSKPSIALPCFDVARMQRECDLYIDWYLPKIAGKAPTSAQSDAFHHALRPAWERLANLPKVPVHLDYHSRNLMLPASGLPLAIIDYQDAVMGPVTYDLASLLYDCYQDYSESERRHWSHVFFTALPACLSRHFKDADDWHDCLRLTAFQRHLKAIGIFARLAYRDGKHQFLDEIPLTRKHLHEEMQALQISSTDIPLLARSSFNISDLNGLILFKLKHLR